MTRITSVAQLEEIYGTAGTTSVVKVARQLTPEYRQLIGASPFLTLATAGAAGVDCSPRGDRHELVRVESDTSLLLPDRRGNNRIDSLRNIVEDGRLALLFLLPGSGNTLRVNGQGTIIADPQLLASFAVNNRPPRTVLRVAIREVYFQCARAIVRSELWDSRHHVPPETLPSPGQILQGMSDGEVDGTGYDRDWPARAQQTLW